MSAHFHVMAKPAGPACNLRCTYCFYLEKKALFAAGESLLMSEELLDRFVRETIQSQDGPRIDFAWQGGEPTLRGLPFFRKAVELQRKYAAGRTITNALQTNGMLIDEDWAAFLADNGFLVGISIDGPPELHDAHRVDAGGQPTSARVLQGLERLKAAGVEFNTLTTVNAVNVKHPMKVYRYLKEIGSRYLQFIPVVERRGGQVTRWSVGPVAYGRFLTTVFDHWLAHDVGQTFVQLFDSAFNTWVHGQATLCVFAPNCGRQLAMEHDGSVYSCDHYVDPQHRIGRLGDAPLANIVDSPAQRAFGAAKSDSLPEQCRRCEVRAACHGGCPKHRFLPAAGGEPGLNYLCAAYKAFFRHVAPQMNVLAQSVRQAPAPV